MVYFYHYLENFFDHSPTMTFKNSSDSDKNTTHALFLNLSEAEPNLHKSTSAKEIKWMI